MDDLERFAARLVAEWSVDPRSGDCPAARWLDQFACLGTSREPDSCPDALSRLPGDERPIRWYDNGECVIAFRGDRECYVIAWRAVDGFLRQSLSCDDDELPPEPDVLPLTG